MTDLRHALRQLATRPGFTVIAVVTLALGIGATTTIFSVVDHLMLRDLPFPDADRVVTLWQTNAREGIPREDVAPGNYLDWKARTETFAAMGAAEPHSVDLTGESRPEVILTNLVTDRFFEALGVQRRARRGSVRWRRFDMNDGRATGGDPLCEVGRTDPVRSGGPAA